MHTGPDLPPNWTPTQPPESFTVDRNLFNPGNGPVSIHVAFTKSPGPYHLKIYNSAEEWILTLTGMHADGSVNDGFTWDRKNCRGDPVASGVYVIHLASSPRAEYRRLLAVR